LQLEGLLVAQRQQRRLATHQLLGTGEHELDELFAVIRDGKLACLADERRQAVFPLFEEVNQPGVDQGIGGIGRDARQVAQVVLGERITGGARQRQYPQPLFVGEQRDRNEGSRLVL